MCKSKEMIPGYEEQRILGDCNATAEYAAVAEAEFEKCLRVVFSEIAVKAFAGEINIAESVMEKALKCYGKYFLLKIFLKA